MGQRRIRSLHHGHARPGFHLSHGDTPDLAPAGTGPHAPGFLTMGVLDPAKHYYRRVFVDAARAIEAARSHPEVDPAHIAVTGGSQGGGITLAAAGLDPSVEAVMPDVPFLCHYRRASEITDSYPYQEIVQYCHTHRDQIETVFRTCPISMGSTSRRGRAAKRSSRPP